MELFYNILETVSELDSLYKSLIKGNKNIEKKLNDLINKNI